MENRENNIRAYIYDEFIPHLVKQNFLNPKKNIKNELIGYNRCTFSAADLIKDNNKNEELPILIRKYLDKNFKKCSNAIMISHVPHSQIGNLMSDMFGKDQYVSEAFYSPSIFLSKEDVVNIPNYYESEN
eukprot:TRINITY_DN136450_c0_g1_i1.p1 TRINITY_DN136450_c0_g1~~TRINITY_DN136450_c0_g1_i1.p1  ORF type:complete len:130 (+),score=7.43 TRINITY_DN136450_c0_g1_i1:66-455(+)